MLNAKEREKVTKTLDLLAKALKELEYSPELESYKPTDCAWLVGYANACLDEARKLLTEIEEMNA